MSCSSGWPSLHCIAVTPPHTGTAGELRLQACTTTICSLEFYYLKHPEAKMFKSFAYKADFTQLSSRRQWITYHPSTDQKVLTHFWFSSEICSHKIRRKKPYALMGFTFPPVGITKTNKKRMLYHETYFCKTLLFIVFNLHYHQTGTQFNHQSNEGDRSLYSHTGSKQFQWHHQLV